MSKPSILIAALLLLISSHASALEYSLSIQPILPKAQITEAYQPLADYLSAKTGHTIRIEPHTNFLTYWSGLRSSNSPDLVLDAAHFTDYRVQKKNYDVLAKLPDTVSFSIVTHEDEFIFDIDELVLKKVATMVSPSVGAIRLLSLFNNPMKQPRIVYATDSNDAAQQVRDRKVFAAIIPTALVSRYEGLNTVMTTESLPHMAFSAAPSVPFAVRDSIKQALLSAKDSAEGQAMLDKINFASFEATSAESYKGYSSLLEHVLGY